jgi:hypothetical protein
MPHEPGSLWQCADLHGRHIGSGSGRLIRAAQILKV